MGLAETWLTTDNVVQYDGYKWLGNNRRKISGRANRGYGLVRALIRTAGYLG